MASLIPGFEYDIFISYRQKDNKGDRWVSEFVEALKTELESTFKEDISVYFDINPHDGLLETYDVDASLKDKLKCLVFIPIISRTYCDPKSFAWEHEFKAFIEQASKDQFGLRVKLPNGNVANRMIPVQIHDLYPEDKTLIERELGGVIRAIEFIYKEPGVNRPLTANDDKEINLNKTKYKNQINKVANAIDEIIHGLKGRHTISDDRKLLSDEPYHDAKEGKYIEATETSVVIQKSKKWLIIMLSVLLCVASAFAIFKIFEGRKKSFGIAKLEKSIAVLPFVNDSPVDSNKYFINGIMDEILTNLQKIKDFRVLSRTSTEQYRGTAKPMISEIAKKLDVNYIVEGSGQKYGNKFVLRVQLIAAKNEKHLWGESYEKEITETSDIFKIQSEVAQAIATELKISITPAEKTMIEKSSTLNLTAYDLYQRGKEELSIFKKNRQDTEALSSAETYFQKALEYDPEYSLAYTGMATVYWLKHFWNEYFSEHFLDSVLIMSDKALSFDRQLSDAYLLKGHYYRINGINDKAFVEYEKAIKFNPNNWEGYCYLGELYCDYENIDLVKGIEYLLKAVSLNQGKELASLLRRLGKIYGTIAGFPEKEKYYVQEAFKLDGDTNVYFSELADIEFLQRNYGRAIELYHNCYARDSDNVEFLANLAYAYYMLDKSRESLMYVKKFEKRLKEVNWVYYSAMKRIGYVYLQTGFRKEAEYWFYEQERISKESLKMGRLYSIDANYDLAAIYAFRGEKKKAYVNLKEVARIRFCHLWMLSVIKDEPLFNNIRNEPEFKRIVNEWESKYQAEHERVSKWQEEKGKL